MNWLNFADIWHSQAKSEPNDFIQKQGPSFFINETNEIPERYSNQIRPNSNESNHDANKISDVSSLYRYAFKRLNTAVLYSFVML